MTAIILYLTSYKNNFYFVYFAISFFCCTFGIYFKEINLASIMLRKLYLYVLLFVSVSAFSQVKVEGTVIDELSSKPLQRE